MALVDGKDYPEHLYYDLDNQIWYEPLPDGTIRAGFTPIAIALAGDVLVFTPKRIGRDFEAQRSFATIECGKWVGSGQGGVRRRGRGCQCGAGAQAEAAQRGRLRRRLDADRPPRDAGWRYRLVTGPAVGPEFAAWMAAEAYKDRSA